MDPLREWIKLALEAKKAPDPAAALRQPLIVFECQNANQPSAERLIATFEGPTFRLLV